MKSKIFFFFSEAEQVIIFWSKIPHISLELCARINHNNLENEVKEVSFDFVLTYGYS